MNFFWQLVDSKKICESNFPMNNSPYAGKHFFAYQGVLRMSSGT
jgi:hypothetical protein